MTAPSTWFAASRAAAIAAGLTPLMIGALDAAAHRACLPEAYSPWDGDQAEYSEGYRLEAVYLQGQADYTLGRYAPPVLGFAEYLKGYHTARAMAQGSA